MLEINLNMYHATAIAAIVLLLGRFIVSKVPLLRNYCIPAPLWAASCTLWFTWACTLPELPPSALMAPCRASS